MIACFKLALKQGFSALVTVISLIWYEPEGVNHDSHTPLGSRIVTYDHYTTCMQTPTVLTRSGGHSHVIFSPCEDLNALP